MTQRVYHNGVGVGAAEIQIVTIADSCTDVDVGRVLTLTGCSSEVEFTRGENSKDLLCAATIEFTDSSRFATGVEDALDLDSVCPLSLLITSVTKPATGETFAEL